VRDVSFEGVCMRRTAHPMVFDTRYSDKTGDRYPDFQDIRVTNFHYLGGGRFGGGVLTFRGFDEQGQRLPLGVSLGAIRFDGPPPQIGSRHGGRPDGQALATHFTILPGAADFANLLKSSSENDVTVQTAEARTVTPVSDCVDVFVPLNDILPDSPI